MYDGDAPMVDTDFHPWTHDALVEADDAWVLAHAHLSDDDLALAVLLGAITTDQARRARVMRDAVLT